MKTSWRAKILGPAFLAASLQAVEAAPVTPAETAAGLQDAYAAINNMRFRGTPDFRKVLFIPSIAEGETEAEFERRTRDLIEAQMKRQFRIWLDEERLDAVFEAGLGKNMAGAPEMVMTTAATVYRGYDPFARVCMPRTLPDVGAEELDGDIKGFIGIPDGEARPSEFPFDYKFDLVSPEAWTRFKQHYTAAQCLVVKEKFLPETEGDDDIHMIMDAGLKHFGIAFSAFMTARDGFPEIVPFVADLYAATFENHSGFTMLSQDLNLLTDRSGWIQDKSFLRGISSYRGGVHVSYPSFVIDHVQANLERYLELPVAAVMQDLLNEALYNPYGRDIPMVPFVFDGTPDINPNNPDTVRVLARRSEAAARGLDLCVDPAAGASPEDFRKSIAAAAWAPPACAGNS